MSLTCSNHTQADQLLPECGAGQDLPYPLQPEMDDNSKWLPNMSERALPPSRREVPLTESSRDARLGGIRVKTLDVFAGFEEAF